MDHEHLINLWPSLADFARDLDVKYQTARFMKKRNSIPPKYWRRVEKAARERGIRGATYSALETAYPYAESA